MNAQTNEVSKIDHLVAMQHSAEKPWVLAIALV